MNPKTHSDFSSPSFVRPFTSLKLAPIVLFAFAITAVLTQRAFASQNELIITENSPTDLSATYNGSPLTVLLGGPEGWDVLPPSSVVFSISGAVEQLGFTEPED